MATLAAAARAYWSTPPAQRTPLELTGLSALPSLLAWVHTHRALLHPTDLRRLLQIHQALGHAPGHSSPGQVTAAVDHLVGIGAEVL